MKTTIQGYTFDVTEPYGAGAKIGDVEARALNQLRAENIGNNQRKVVQAMIEKQPKVPVKDENGNVKVDANGDSVTEHERLSDEQLAELQADLTNYDEGYTLDMARGGRTTDPVEKMARDIARALLAQTVKAQGFGSLKAWREKVGDDAYNAKLNEIAAKPQVRKQAKATVNLEI